MAGPAIEPVSVAGGPRPLAKSVVEGTGGAHAKRSRPNSSRKPGTIARFVRSCWQTWAGVDRKDPAPMQEPSVSSSTSGRAPATSQSQVLPSPTSHVPRLSCCGERRSVSTGVRTGNWGPAPELRLKFNRRLPFHNVKSMPPSHRGLRGLPCPSIHDPSSRPAPAFRG